MTTDSSNEVLSGLHWHTAHPSCLFLKRQWPGLESLCVHSQLLLVLLPLEVCGIVSAVALSTSRCCKDQMKKALLYQEQFILQFLSFPHLVLILNLPCKGSWLSFLPLSLLSPSRRFKKLKSNFYLEEKKGPQEDQKGQMEPYTSPVTNHRLNKDDYPETYYF